MTVHVSPIFEKYGLGRISQYFVVYFVSNGKNFSGFESMKAKLTSFSFKKFFSGSFFSIYSVSFSNLKLHVFYK